MVLFRVVLLGEGGVGKTALTIQFIQHKFVTDYDPTIENSYRKQMTYQDGDTEINCILDILDTAGQEEYSVMRQQYISRGQGFVLVFSVVNQLSFRNLKKFRKEIVRVKELDAPIADMPVVLLGNKTDLEKERVVTTEDAKEKATKWNYQYLETSAKDGTGITEAFELLVQKMWRQQQQKKAENGTKDNPDAPKEKKDPTKKKDPAKKKKAQGHKKKTNKKYYKKHKKNGTCMLI